MIAEEKVARLNKILSSPTANIAALAEFLAQNKRQLSTHPNNALIKSSDAAKETVDYVLSVVRRSFDSKLVALLLNSPSGYDTPWFFACELLSEESNSTMKHENILDVVSRIQGFLQDVTSHWFDIKCREQLGKRVSTVEIHMGEHTSTWSPLPWMLRLTRSVLSVMYNRSDCEALDILTELVEGLATVLHDWDEDSLNQLRDMIFQAEPKVKQFPVWLRLLYRLRHHLLEGVLTKANEKLQQLLRQNTEGGRLYSSLVETVFLFCQFDDTIDWKVTVVQLLEHCLVNRDTYESIESTIAGAMMCLSTAQRIAWINFLSHHIDTNTSEMPSLPIVVNMFLLVVGSCDRTSGSVQRIIRLGNSPAGQMIQAPPRWPVVVDFLLERQLGSDDNVRDTFVSSLKTSTYYGKGKFVKEDDLSMQSRIGGLVYESLYPDGDTRKTCYRSFAGRVQKWIEIAVTQFQNEPSSVSSVCGVVMTVLYFEVKHSRRQILSFIEGWVSDERNPQSTVEIISTIARSIVPSKSLSEDDYLEFGSFCATVLKHPFPLEQFSCLAWAFQSVIHCQRGLLLRVRQGLSLQASCSRKSRDQKIGITACCVLIASPDETRFSRHAWGILSDIITCENPCLSVEVRSWLFHTLAGLCVEQKFGEDLLNKLAHAGFRRFTAFCEKSSFRYRLSLEASIAMIESQTDTITRQKEDVGALFALMVSTVPNKAWQSSDLCRVLRESVFASSKENRVRKWQGKGGWAGRRYIMVCTLVVIICACGVEADIEVDDSSIGYLTVVHDRPHDPRQFHSTITAGTKLELLDQVIRVVLLSVQGEADADSPEANTRQLEVLVRIMRHRGLLRQDEANPTYIDLNAWVDCFSCLLKGWHTVGYSVSQKTGLRILGALVESCLGVRPAVIKGVSIENGMQLAGQLWSFYGSCAREIAAKRVVNELDKLLDGQPGMLRYEGGFPSTLPEISNPEGVDLTVQYVREAVFAAYANCLSILATIECDTGRSTTLALQLSALLGSCCDDLYLGLAGSSGGLTKNIFSQLVGLATKCTEVMLALVIDKSGSASILQLMTSCSTAESRLRSMLCQHDITPQTLFKSTSQLCHVELPRLRRYLYRQYCFLSTDINALKEADKRRSVLFDALGQCVQMTQLHSAAVYSGTMWDEVLCDDPSSDDSSQASVPKSQTNEIRLYDEKSWSSVFCSCLTGLEDIWTAEKGRIVSEHFSCRATMETFFTNLLETNQIALSILAPLFTSINECRSMNTVHAVVLPESVKTRLVSALGRIASTLSNALNLIGLEEAGEVTAVTAKVWRVSLLEATARVLAWRTATPPLALSAGVRDWCNAEAAAATMTHLIRVGIIHPNSTILLRRLPKLLEQVELLEAEVLGSPEASGREEFVDYLILAQKLCKRKGDPVEWYETLIDEESTNMRQIQLGMDSVASLQAFRKQKRKEEKQVLVQARKAKRRKVVRSRHKTVDQWLHQDREIDEQEPVDEDAFSDLEDFLVDG